jgi:hypothetical protein
LSEIKEKNDQVRYRELLRLLEAEMTNDERFPGSTAGLEGKSPPVSTMLRAASQRGPQMVSIDHFRYELLAQLGRAARGGGMDVLINSGELCRAIPRGSAWSNACCDAMQEEFRPGDTMVLDRSSGAGMTVRYLLPRLGN